ncbi:MAG: DUF3127 domain-containing protein [Flavobacteriaceae bacterium]|nr:DUF3127 domain-containing protein [Flavobacteriaceae bacterium]
MDVQGKVTKMFETQTFQSGFQKREIVVTTNEQYPQPISIEFTQDKISILDNINVGDNVKVSINLRGREWTSPDGVVKYFNTLQGWRVDKIISEQITGESASNSPVSPTNSFNASVDNLENESSDMDDLPF